MNHAEIFDLRRGREWLYTAPAWPDRPPEYGADYLREFDVGGFDECFPTIRPCAYPVGPWAGTPLPSHGEVWPVPWAVRCQEDVLTLTVEGVRLPYRLKKSLRLLGDGAFLFSYRAANLSAEPLPFIWSSHPMFAARPGMLFRLPVTSMRVFHAPAFPVAPGQVIGWPDFQGFDLGRVPDPGTPLAVKLFSPPLAEGWAEVADPSAGAGFRFEFDPAVVTHFGLWLNYNGSTGMPGGIPPFNFAPEPCIGGAGALDVAVNEWQEYGTLPAGGDFEWWLRMVVS